MEKIDNLRIGEFEINFLVPGNKLLSKYRNKKKKNVLNIILNRRD
jgi:hypothetical protein